MKYGDEREATESYRDGEKNALLKTTQDPVFLGRRGTAQSDARVDKPLDQMS